MVGLFELPLALYSARMKAVGRLFVAAVLVVCGLGSAQARPLTAGEERVLRAAPPLAEQNRTPAHLRRFRDAADLARRLGAEGVLDALPVLIEARQINVLNEFAGAYKADATPELEAIALRHLDDPDVGPRVVAMLRRIRSPALFDALIAALPRGKIECDTLLRAAATAEVPGVDPRLAQLLPKMHPHPARFIAARLAERQYREGEGLLLDLLKRAPLDSRSTLSSLATHITRLPGDATVNAAARKLIEISRLPEDKSPRKFGLISSIRLDEIPDDGLLCSTPMLRAPMPLGDARSREVRELTRIVRIAPPDAVLDRAIFDAGALEAFAPEERKAVQAMLAERTRSEALYRDVTPDNFLHWIAGIESRLVKAFIARGADVNAPSSLGVRPLAYAAGQLKDEAVALLLAAGADPNLSNVEPNRDGNAALHAVSDHQARQAIPVEHGVRIMKALLAAGANVKARNKWGAMPLQFAATRRPELVALLLEAGADVKAADANGTTALHTAAHGGQRAIAQTLLDRGAEVNAEEKGGVTPLLIARDNKNKELEQLFAARGGRINQAYYLKREAARELYRVLRGTGH